MTTTWRVERPLVLKNEFCSDAKTFSHISERGERERPGHDNNQRAEGGAHAINVEVRRSSEAGSDSFMHSSKLLLYFIASGSQ